MIDRFREAVDVGDDDRRPGSPCLECRQRERVPERSEHERVSGADVPDRIALEALEVDPIRRGALPSTRSEPVAFRSVPDEVQMEIGMRARDALERLEQHIDPLALHESGDGDDRRPLKFDRPRVADERPPPAEQGTVLHDANSGAVDAAGGERRGSAVTHRDDDVRELEHPPLRLELVVIGGDEHVAMQWRQQASGRDRIRPVGVDDGGVEAAEDCVQPRDHPRPAGQRVLPHEAMVRDPVRGQQRLVIPTAGDDRHPVPCIRLSAGKVDRDIDEAVPFVTDVVDEMDDREAVGARHQPYLAPAGAH